jgi:hypothetical protein
LIIIQFLKMEMSSADRKLPFPLSSNSVKGSQHLDTAPAKPRGSSLAAPWLVVTKAPLGHSNLDFTFRQECSAAPHGDSSVCTPRGENETNKGEGKRNGRHMS